MTDFLQVSCGWVDVKQDPLINSENLDVSDGSFSSLKKCAKLSFLCHVSDRCFSKACTPSFQLHNACIRPKNAVNDSNGSSKDKMSVTFFFKSRSELKAVLNSWCPIHHVDQYIHISFVSGISKAKPTQTLADTIHNH